METNSSGAKNFLTESEMKRFLGAARQGRHGAIKRAFVSESLKLTLKPSGSTKAATFRAGAILPGKNCCAAT